MIDGKPVKFKNTAGTMIRYRNQFNREFFSDLVKLRNVEKDLSVITLSPFYDIVWVLAKTADDSIGDPLTWYDSFDNFPIIDVFTQLKDIIMATIKTKNSAAAAAPNRQMRRKHRR
jgi:hypothetical protein